MVEPAAAVVLGPVGRAIAPPGEAALGGGHEAAADIDPAMRLLQRRQRFDFDRGVTDDTQQRLVAPDVAFQRRDIEVADDDGWLAKAVRPAGHAADEVELLAELGVLLAVGNVAPGRHIDIFDPDSAFEPRADMASLA